MPRFVSAGALRGTRAFSRILLGKGFGPQRGGDPMAFPNRLERNAHRGLAIRDRLMTVGLALLALAIAPSASAL